LLPDGRRVFAKSMFFATASMNVPANAFFSSPLVPGAETFALFHLDGALEDAGRRAPALVLAGNAAFDTNNLSWMAKRKGATLQFKGPGDKATTRINLPPSQQLSEITIQAMIYLNAFKGYNKANVKILSLSENWESSIELHEDKYAGAIIRGGTEFSIDFNAVKNALKPAAWNHFSMTIDKDGYTARVNGKVIGTEKSGELARWGKQPATLEFGNFDGYIDEVAVICKTSPGSGSSIATQSGTGSGK